MSREPFDRDTLSAVFAGKYEDAGSDWGRGSGPGSDPTYTLPYRSFLESFIRLNTIGSVVDIGCGDWRFSRFVDWSGVRYLGLDVVDSVVAANRDRFGAEGVDFQPMPDRLEAVPGGDLLIMKDVLQHLPEAQIRAFHREVFPRYRFCLITNSYRKADAAVNVDIALGDFRCLDLTAPPFGFDGAYVLQFSSGVWEEVRTLLVSRPEG